MRLRLKRKTHLAFRVLNVFYFQTDFNLRFKRKRDLRLTCKRAFDGSYIAHYSLKCLCTLHRISSLKWISSAVSETKTETETLTDHISKFAFQTCQTCQTCQTRFEFLSQFRKVRNAFECFVTQVQTHLPKTKCVWPMKINVICTVHVYCKARAGHWKQVSILMRQSAKVSLLYLVAILRCRTDTIMEMQRQNHWLWCQVVCLS